MTGGHLRRLGACRRGATVIEFAVLAPLFLAMLLCLIEGARLLWTRQTLENVAHVGARCMATGASACVSVAATRSHVVTLAAERGIRLQPADVTPEVGVICEGVGGFDRVSVQASFDSPARGLLPLPQQIAASACFPTAPA